MISNRASDAGTPKRNMTGAKTLAAALVLSIAGIGAAHACPGTLTVVNNTDRVLKGGQLYTETDGGKKRANFDNAEPAEVAPGASATAWLHTSRGKNVEFHVVMDSPSHGRNRSTNGRCRDGCTMTYDW